MDGCPAGATRFATPGALPPVRPVDGDYGAHPHWLPLLEDGLARGVVMDTIDREPPNHGGGSRGVVVAGVADHPSPVAEGNLVADHAHSMVDLETSERCSL